VTGTYRTKIRSPRRPHIWICAVTGLLLFSFLFAPAEFLQLRWPYYIFGACSVVWFVSFTWLCYYIKCPRCGKNLPLMPTRDIPTYSTMNFCPCCGVNLDAECA